MTPEQKQQIEQISERVKRLERAAKDPHVKTWDAAYYGDVYFLLSLVKSQEAESDMEVKDYICHKFIHLHDGNCPVHGFVRKQEPPKLEWEYCPACAGELDTGYECTKCGRDWQSYVHDAVLRIETETEQ